MSSFSGLRVFNQGIPHPCLLSVAAQRCASCKTFSVRYRCHWHRIFYNVQAVFLSYLVINPRCQKAYVRNVLGGPEIRNIVQDRNAECNPFTQRIQAPPLVHYGSRLSLARSQGGLCSEPHARAANGEARQPLSQLMIQGGAPPANLLQAKRPGRQDTASQQLDACTSSDPVARRASGGVLKFAERDSYQLLQDPKYPGCNSLVEREAGGAGVLPSLDCSRTRVVQQHRPETACAAASCPPMPKCSPLTVVTISIALRKRSADPRDQAAERQK